VRRTPAEPAEVVAARPPARIDIELTPGISRPDAAKDPFAALVHPGAASVPEPAGDLRRGSPSPDPFAAAGLGHYAEPAPEQKDDPFAVASAAGLSSGSSSEPASKDANQSLPPQADPFSFASGAAPFSQPELPEEHPSSPNLAVTDLSQLLGGDPGRSALGLSAATGPGERASAAVAPILTEVDLAEEFSLGSDLALEERSAPIPAPSFADPADVFLSGGVDPGSFGGAAFEEGPQAMAPLGEESIALPGDLNPLPEPLEEPVPPQVEEPPPKEVRPPRVMPPKAAVEDEVARAAPPPTRAERVRSAAVSALALIALIGVALAFRVVWRGDVPLGPALFRPSNLLRALGRAAVPQGPFEVAGVHSGIYEQGGGGEVLFVRGEVISRAKSRVESVKVAAELVRDGQVLARGEAVAGALPTPEEVHAATDRASLDALAAEARTRAPRSVAPGDRVGFLVVLGDAPADVSGTSVRVRAEAAGG
jgi:hypothetical protein